MRLHKEGRKYIGFSLAILLPLFIIFSVVIEFEPLLILANVALLALFIFLLQFFRNPQFPVEIHDDVIYAPADGKVVVIEKTLESEYLHQEYMQLSIFMSPFNVHVNRNPVSGVISYFKYHKGKYLVAWHPKSSTENERTTLVYEHSKGKILVRQIAGIVARRICWYVKEQDNVKQGEEFGFIKFGSRVDVFVPLDAKISVHLNDKTKGGKTVLATW